MPELPEVEAVCRRLRESVGSRSIVRAALGRASLASPQSTKFVERAANGRSIVAVARRGKNILLELDGGWSLRIHLRMTGNLYRVPDGRLLVSTVRASFQMSDGTAIVLDDQRALGKIQAHKTADLEKILTDIGPEPSQMNAADLRGIAGRSRQPVKLLLMDQTKISGLGNIYAAECLYRARIHPAKPSNRLSPASVARLHAAAVQVLEEGVESAYRAYSKPGEFQEGESFPVEVYDREGEPCGRCHRLIRRITQGGRSTYFCPGCQR